MAEGDFELYINHGAGYVRMTKAENNRVISRPWEWNENRPKVLTLRLDNDTSAATQNLLSPSCALWSSGTGAMDIGDTVDYSITSTTDTVSLVNVFRGTIASITPHDDRTIDIVCVDRLASYQGVGKSIFKTFYKSYLDQIYKYHSTAGESIALTGLSEADILAPPAIVELLSNDASLVIGPAGNIVMPGSPTNYYGMAQSFIASQDSLIGLYFPIKFEAAFGATDMKVAICLDSSGSPGTEIATATIPNASVQRDGNLHYWSISFTSSDEPLPLVPGKRYWIKIIPLTRNAWTKASVWNLQAEDNPAGQSDIIPLKFSDNDSTWVIDGSRTTHAANISVFTATYADQSSGAQVFSPAAGTLTFTKIKSATFNQVPANYSSTWTPKRGRLSYYYNLKNVKEIIAGIIGIGPCTANVHSSIANTINLYRTKGRYLNECLEELVELREPSGAFSGSQLAMMSYRSGSTDYIGVARRLNLADASARTFSYAPDTATDDDRRVMTFNATKTIKGRACSVTVTGQSEGGEPIMITVSDKSLSGGGYSTKSGVLLELSITDDSLKTVADCARAGYAKLDSIARDQWEGTLIIDGIFPELVDMNPASSTFGSGKIITLNYSPYGITNTKFKVKGIRIGTDEGDNFVTEVQISNMSPLVNNPFEDTAATTLRNEAFLSPTDGQATFYIAYHHNQVLPLGTWLQYLGLKLAVGSELHGQQARAVASVIENSTHNQRIFHAEFPAGIGYTIDGTDLVTVLYYNSTAVSVDIALPAALHFPKWKTCRVIVDLITRLS